MIATFTTTEAHTMKILSLLVITASMLAGLPYVLADDLKAEDIRPATASPSVEADPLPLDLSEAHAIPARAPATATPTVVAVRDRVWTCGDPEPLATDSTATVRRCEWR